jgi:hypothetical protein
MRQRRLKVWAALVMVFRGVMVQHVCRVFALSHAYIKHPGVFSRSRVLDVIGLTADEKKYAHFLGLGSWAGALM